MVTKSTSKISRALSLLAVIIVILIQLSSINTLNANTSANESVSGADSDAWSINIEKELKELNQAYLINFTAAWCITCQANDKLALSRPAVKTYFEENNIKYIKADWTNRDNDILEVLTEYGRTGVPLYLYWKPGLDKTLILPAVLTEELLINSL